PQGAVPAGGRVVGPPAVQRQSARAALGKGESGSVARHKAGAFVRRAPGRGLVHVMLSPMKMPMLMIGRWLLAAGR
ncbi:MAG: hypothetical protein M1546_18600, partial [Chloroflexi bacterium]|nr:hypothetical protein [Chloroflexota bacterium]